METVKFVGMLTLLGAALGCSVGMLAGVLRFSSMLAKVLLIGAAAGAALGLIAGLICVILKSNAQKHR